MKSHPLVDMKSKHSSRWSKALWIAVVLASFGGFSYDAAGQEPLQLDETCTVTLGNQTAIVRPDGSFLIRNIAIFVPGASVGRRRRFCLGV